MPKPRLAIVGLGRYYRKLEHVIPDCFTAVLKVEEADVKGSGEAVRSLVERAKADAVMLLTPNELHVKHIVELADLRLPVVAEKPLVTSERDLEQVLDVLQTNPRLDCSDFYLDVRAVALLEWVGEAYPACLGR